MDLDPGVTVHGSDQSQAGAQHLTKQPCTEFRTRSSSGTTQAVIPPSTVEDVNPNNFTFTFCPPFRQLINPFTQIANQQQSSLRPFMFPAPVSDVKPVHFEFEGSDMVYPPRGYTSISAGRIPPRPSFGKTGTEPVIHEMIQNQDQDPVYPKSSMPVVYNTSAFLRQPRADHLPVLSQSEANFTKEEYSSGSNETEFTLQTEEMLINGPSAATTPMDGIGSNVSHPYELGIRPNDQTIRPGPPFSDIDPRLISRDDTAISESEYDDMISLIPNRGQGPEAGTSVARIKEYQTTPLFSRKAELVLKQTLMSHGEDPNIFGQFGLLGLQETGGKNINQNGKRTGPSSNDLIFTNMDAPWSVFICGSQGAGKSHTLSCLLENSLLASKKLGRLPAPLSGIVFHYDKFSSSSSTQVCEAAYLCSSNIPVTVLVSPSNIWAMKRMYRDMPGMPVNAPVPTVLPLYLSEKQLDISRILKLMAVDPTANNTPLYMEVVMNILREMAMEGLGNEGFSYSAFRKRLQDARWLGGQQTPLSMRLSLLESFMVPSETTGSTRPAAADRDIWDFPQGSLTIIDLSDPFVDENDACALFSICLSVFLEQRSTCGRVVGLDEAHKFLTKSGEAKILTDSLTSVMREQRHTGTRVLIATQEPTLSPVLIDLANVTIVHRFLSPAWYEVLRGHLAGAHKDEKSGNGDLFDTIVALETGQALLFCPTALVTAKATQHHMLDPLGNQYIKMRIRARITADGGKSIMANDRPLRSKGLSVANVPMHIVTKPPISLFQLSSKRGKKTAATPKWDPVATRNQVSTQVTNDSQPMPEGSSNNVSKPTKSIPSHDELCAKIREHTEQCFIMNGWQSPQNVPWEKLWGKIEDDLRVKRSYIQTSGKAAHYQALVQDVINKCRIKRGWKGIP